VGGGNVEETPGYQLDPVRSGFDKSHFYQCIRDLTREMGFAGMDETSIVRGRIHDGLHEKLP